MKLYLLSFLFISFFTINPCSVKKDTLNTQNNFEYNIEIKAGLECVRGIPAAVISFKVPPDEKISFVPEMSFILGIMPSISLRYQIQVSKALRSFLQGGHGYIFLAGPASFLGAGFEIKLNEIFSIQSEIRILFSSNSDLNSNNLNIKKHKPLVIMIGLAF